MDAITFPPAPTNEPNLTYAPGSPERAGLVVEIDKLQRKQHNLRAVIGGRRRSGGGEEIKVVQPHDHQPVLGTLKSATENDAQAAVRAAAKAAPDWRAMPVVLTCAAGDHSPANYEHHHLNLLNIGTDLAHFTSRRLCHPPHHPTTLKKSAPGRCRR